MVAARKTGLPLWLLIGFVVVLIAIKLSFSLVTPPSEDEAYYWLWGQHPELSYFDNAPLVGWAQAVSYRLFGWNLLGLRAASLATLAGTAVIFLFWAKRLAADDWPTYFWGSLAIYLASPVVFATGSLAYPDHWLMFLLLVSAHFFARFFADRLDGKPLRHLDLYLAAMFLGLAALSKYNAVVFGVAIAVTIILSRRLRPLLRDPNLYLAALVSVAMLAPVFYWNATHDFVSLRYQLYERHGADLEAIELDRFVRYVVTSLVYLGPVLLIPLINFLRRPAGDGFSGALGGIGKTAFFISCAVFFYLALFVPSLPHWNLPAVLVFLSLAMKHIWSRWLLLLHIVLGTAIVGLAAGYYMMYAFVPQTSPDVEASRLYGWEIVGKRALELKQQHGAVAIASYFYGTVSRLAFAVRTTEVTTLADNIDAFDEWRDPAWTGKDLVIIDDGNMGELRPQFTTLERLDTVAVSPFRSYELYLGRGYKPTE